MSVLDLSPRKLGSIEEYLAVLSAMVTDAGGRSMVAVSTDPSPDVAALFNEAGVELEVLPFLAGDPAVAARLSILLEQYRPDIVHFHFVALPSALFALAGSSGAKVFVSHHTSVDPGRQRSLLRRLAAYMRNIWRWRHVTRFVTPSEYTRRYIIKDYFISPGRAVTIHNGVNLVRHQPGKMESLDIRSNYNIPPEEKIVIHIAYAHAYKGIDDFVRSATVLKEKKIQFRHLVVGDGERMTQYKTLAAELGVADNVTFTGLADGNMINSLLAQCDISTLACTWGEAFSLVVLESMARGKAMVATAVGGTPEAVTQGETGLLVSPWDWRQLGESIALLLEDDGLRTRLGEAARERAEKLFNIERWVRRTLALYATNNPDAWECLHSGTQDRDSVVG